MIETAYGFLEQNPQYEQFNRQFDVLLVDFSQYPAQITHYPAAFWLEEPF